jgi:hypothetical protein
MNMRMELKKAPSFFVLTQGRKVMLTDNYRSILFNIILIIGSRRIFTKVR